MATKDSSGPDRVGPVTDDRVRPGACVRSSRGRPSGSTGIENRQGCGSGIAVSLRRSRSSDPRYVTKESAWRGGPSHSSASGRLAGALRYFSKPASGLEPETFHYKSVSGRCVLLLCRAFRWSEVSRVGVRNAEFGTHFGKRLMPLCSPALSTGGEG